MNLNELFTDTPIDEKQIWAKSGQKVVRKYRCTSGARKGRIVAKPGQCFAAPNIKARFNMKRTRARVGKKMVRLGESVFASESNQTSSIKLLETRRRDEREKRRLVVTGGLHAVASRRWLAGR